MKRYLIFGGSSYYPSGGFADLIGDADTLDEAIATAADLEKRFPQCSFGGVEWWHVIDTQTRECVRESEEKPLGGGMQDRTVYQKDYVDGVLVAAPVKELYEHRHSTK